MSMKPNQPWRTLLIAGGIYAGAMAINFFVQKDMAVSLARKLCTGKGIINIGAGCGRSFVSQSYCDIPEVVVNVDINVDPDCADCLQVNLETASLPYDDGHFDVALASHVLEHLANWETALTEWCRVADHVILVLPNPFSLGQYNPEHKQHFTFAEMADIRSRWPKTEIFA